MEQVDTKKRILIVDDEPNMRRLSRKILSNTFDVVEAEDGRQGEPQNRSYLVLRLSAV